MSIDTEREVGERDGLVWRSWPLRAEERGHLILLHGFAGDGLTWSLLAPKLAQQGWRCEAPDLPAHGGSELEADDVETLLDLLEPRLPQDHPFGLVGHSLGGALATRLAARGRLPVTSLTLLSPAGIGPDVDGDFLRGIARVDSGEALLGYLRRLAVQPPQLPLALAEVLARTLGPRGRLLALADALADGDRQRLDILPDLAGLRLPTRLAMGLRDDIIPWTQVANLPPRVAIHLLGRAAHLPHWDQADDVAALFA